MVFFLPCNIDLFSAKFPYQSIDRLFKSTYAYIEGLLLCSSTLCFPFLFCFPEKKSLILVYGIAVQQHFFVFWVMGWQTYSIIEESSI